MTTTPTFWKGLTYSGDGLLPVGYSGAASVTERYDNMVALPGGGFILFWADIISYQAQVYDAEGKRQGDVITILPYDNVALLKSFSSIITLNDGTTLVAVDSDHNSDRDFGLLAFNPDGTQKSEDFLTTLSAEWLYKNTVHLTALADGGYVSSWHAEVNNSGTYEHMAIKRFDANGVAQNLTGGPVPWDNSDGDTSNDSGNITARTDEVRAHDALDSSSQETTVGLATGGFVAIWVNFDDDLYVRWFDENGVPKVPVATTEGNPNYPVDINTADDQLLRQFGAVALNNGNIALGWVENSPGYGVDYHIAVYGADGRIVLADTNLTTDPGGGDVNTLGNRTLSAPVSIIALEDGGFATAWLEDFLTSGVGNSRYRIKFQVFDSDGSERFAEITLRESNQSSDTYTVPKILQLDDGTLLLAWFEPPNGVSGAAYPFHAVRFDAQGNQVGEFFSPIDAANPTISPESPDLALLADGRVLVSVDDDTQSTPFAILDPRDSVIKGDATGETITSRKDGASVFGRDGNDNLLGQGAKDILKGGDGKDMLLGRSGNDKLYGEAGKDDLSGGKGNDKLYGGGNDDKMDGDSGNDRLTGDKGDDVLFGGSGKDWIAGGKGDDRLKGEAGDDRFVFAKHEGSDTILDFQNNRDRIDLKAFGYGSKADALSHFSESGSPNNDVIVFDDRGTHIKIKGIDMAQLDKGDIIV